MALLPTETLDFGDGDARHPDARQGLAHLVELERLDDGRDHFHVWLLQRARRPVGSERVNGHQLKRALLGRGGAVFFGEDRGVGLVLAHFGGQLDVFHRRVVHRQSQLLELVGGAVGSGDHAVLVIDVFAARCHAPFARQRVGGIQRQAVGLAGTGAAAGQRHVVLGKQIDVGAQGQRAVDVEGANEVEQLQHAIGRAAEQRRLAAVVVRHVGEHGVRAATCAQFNRLGRVARLRADPAVVHAANQGQRRRHGVAGAHAGERAGFHVPEQNAARHRGVAHWVGDFKAGQRAELAAHQGESAGGILHEGVVQVKRVAAVQCLGVVAAEHGDLATET